MVSTFRVAGASKADTKEIVNLITFIPKTVRVNSTDLVQAHTRCTCLEKG